MTDRNAKADSSGDLHEIKVLQAEIERLCKLTENDAKEIGSYREGTGLRGENKRLRAALEVAVDDARVYRAALERIADMHERPAGYSTVVFEIAREALNDE